MATAVGPTLAKATVWHSAAGTDPSSREASKGWCCREPNLRQGYGWHSAAATLLATPRSRRAAGVFGGGDAADVLGEAVGVAVAQLEGEAVSGGLDAFEREMGQAGVVVLEFDGQLVGGEDGLPVLEDFRELGGIDAVVDVVGDPDLEEALTLAADGAAAVDEFLL